MGTKKKDGSDSNDEEIENVTDFSDSAEENKKGASRLNRKQKGKMKKKSLRKGEDDEEDEDNNKENDIEMLEREDGQDNYKRRNSTDKTKGFLKSVKIKERGIFKKSHSFKAKKKVVAVSAFLGKDKNKDRKSTKRTTDSPIKEVSPNPPELFDPEKSLHSIVDGGGGKDKMMWARRAFFMSTEKIFPGFIKNYGLRSNRSRDPTGVKLRTSIPLKMCLLAHSYFVPIWFISFLFLQEFAASSLKPIHSYVHSSLAYACMFIDVFRLYGGFISNTTDDMQLLALYWMATVILQTPMMCFVFATHSFSTHILPMNVAMDIILACILLLEIWFGFYQLKGLVSSEMNLLHMARHMNELNLMKDYDAHGKNNVYQHHHHQPRVVNHPEKGPYLDWSNSSHNSQSSSGEENQEEEEEGNNQLGLGEKLDSSSSKRNTTSENMSQLNNKSPLKKSKKKVKAILAVRGTTTMRTTASSDGNDENKSGSENDIS